MEAITCPTKSTLFVVKKGEWYTKEGRGKSMRNVLYVYSSMAKGTSQAEVMSNSKIIKPMALPLLSYASLKASGRQLVI